MSSKELESQSSFLVKGKIDFPVTNVVTNLFAKYADFMQVNNSLAVIVTFGGRFP